MNTKQQTISTLDKAAEKVDRLVAMLKDQPGEAEAVDLALTLRIVSAEVEADE